jgi:hypothetical protein
MSSPREVGPIWRGGESSLTPRQASLTAAVRRKMLRIPAFGVIFGGAGDEQTDRPGGGHHFA